MLLMKNFPKREISQNKGNFYFGVLKIIFFYVKCLLEVRGKLFPRYIEQGNPCVCVVKAATPKQTKK